MMLSGATGSSFRPAMNPMAVGAGASGSVNSADPDLESRDALARGKDPDSDAGSEKGALNASGERVGSARFDRESINGLAREEIKLVRELASRDREVRAHEQAHANVGGRYAGSPTYSFQRGPDGKQYAVGGEVSIDVSPISGDPQATIEKAQIVRRAALAPAQPSAQDRAVAAEASAIEQQARAELLAQVAETRAQPNGTESQVQGNTRVDADADADALTYTPIDVRA